MIRMGMFETFGNAKNTVQGKALAVFMSLALALSFINVSAFASEGESDHPDASVVQAESAADKPAANPEADDAAAGAEEPATATEPETAPSEKAPRVESGSGGGAIIESGSSDASIALELQNASIEYLDQRISLPADRVDYPQSREFRFKAFADQGYELESVAMAVDGFETVLEPDGEGFYIIGAPAVASGLTVKVKAAAAEDFSGAESEDPSATPIDSETVIEPERNAAASGEVGGRAAEGETVAGEEAVAVIADVSSPAFEGYAYVGNIIVKVTAGEGALPEGTTVQASEVEREDVAEAVASEVESRGKQLQDMVAIDVTLLDEDGNAIQPETPVNVCFFDANVEGEEVGVYRVSDDASTVEAIGARQADAAIQSFDVDHFSIYVVGGSGEKHESPKDAYEMKAGDSVELWAAYSYSYSWSIKQGTSISGGWKSSKADDASLKADSNYATVSLDDDAEEGDAYIVRYGSKNNNYQYFFITVASAHGKVNVTLEQADNGNLTFASDGTMGSKLVERKGSVAVNVDPADGYYCSGVTVEGGGNAKVNFVSDGLYAVENITKDATVSARFEKAPTVTLNAAEHGSLSFGTDIDETVTSAGGNPGSVTVFSNPNEGYYCSGLAVSPSYGVRIVDNYDGSYTLSNIVRNIAVSAAFEANGSAATSKTVKFFVLKPSQGTPTSGADQGSGNYYPNDKENGGVPNANTSTGYPGGSITAKTWAHISKQGSQIYNQSGLDSSYVIEPASLGDFNGKVIAWYVAKNQSDGIHVDGYVVGEKINVNYVANYPGQDNATATYGAKSGDTVQLYSYDSTGLPQREGYEFIGWNTARNGGGTAYQPGEEITLPDSINLYAMWRASDASITVEYYFQQVQDDNTLKYVRDDALTSTKNAKVGDTVFDAAYQIYPVPQGYTYHAGGYDGKTSAVVAANGQTVLQLAYDLNSYRLTTSSDDKSTITSGNAYYFDAEATQDVVFSANEGCSIESVTVDGVALEGDELASAIAAGKVTVDKKSDHRVLVTAKENSAVATVSVWFYGAEPNGEPFFVDTANQIATTGDNKHSKSIDATNAEGYGEEDLKAFSKEAYDLRSLGEEYWYFDLVVHHEGDPGNMWSSFDFAKDKIQDGDDIRYHVVSRAPIAISYQFVSGTPGKELPAGVIDQLSAARTTTAYKYSTVVNEFSGGAYEPFAVTDPVSGVLQGTWTFEPGWDKDEVVNATSDVSFNGTWTYDVAEYNVTYRWAVGSQTPSGFALPDGAAVGYGQPYEVTDAYERYTAEDPYTDVTGSYVFGGWDPSGTITVEGETVVYGTWAYEPADYVVSYEFGGAVPAGHDAPGPDAVKYGQPYEVDRGYYQNMTVSDETGTYTFSGWDKGDFTVSGNETVRGTWTCDVAEYNVTGTIDNGGTVSNASQLIAYGADSEQMVFRAADGYRIVSVTVNGIAQDVHPGMTGYTFDAIEEIDKNYNVDVRTVEMGAVAVVAPSGSKVYDGMTLRASGYVVDGLSEEYALTAEVQGELTNVGSIATTVSNVSILDGDGNDVTENFAISLVEGELSVIPAEVQIIVDDATKEAGTEDPEFTGTVEGLVADGDLGIIVYSRTNDMEQTGTYIDAITASFTPNANYVVTVVPGDFTITSSPAPIPLPTPTPTDTPTPTPAPAATPAPGVLPADDPVAPIAGALADLAETVIGEDETPLAESNINDDETPLATFDYVHCWVHYYLILGIILTVLYGAGVLIRRIRFTSKLKGYEDDILGIDKSGVAAPSAAPVATEGKEA